MKKACTILFVVITLQAFPQNDSVHYHDYIFESQYGASGAYPAEDYMQMITRFTPPYYPAQLIGVRAWFRNAVQPSFYKVVVRTDAASSADANNSNQGYISPSPITNPSSGGAPDSAYEDYVDLSTENLIFNSGDVYAGVAQNLQINGFVGFALDTNSVTPYLDRHWISTGQGAPGTWWMFYNWSFIYARFGVTAFFNPVSTSVAGISENDGVKVFPNPADGLLVIGYPLLEKKAEIKICDSGGRVVFENNFSDEVRISTSNWNNGLYFIQVRNEETLISLKAAVMH